MVCYTCGGSESVETALKLARQYQVEIGQSKRYQVVSRTQAITDPLLAQFPFPATSGGRNYLPMVARVRARGQSLLLSVQL